jgi:hypothetical protein
MAVVAPGAVVGVACANPDVVMRKIEVKVEREVGLADTRRSPSELLLNFVARPRKQQPDARRAKHATATGR